jgi:hypothetical protein
MMLAAVAVVGIGAGLWRAEPSWQVGAVESILVAWILATAATLIVSSTGKAKAFWIGVGIECTLPIAVLIAGGDLFGHVAGNVVNYFHVLHRLSYRFPPILVAWAFAPVVGLLCVFTHWLFIHPPDPKA